MEIESVYEQYYRDVYHFALYFTNNQQEAEDITQETFMKVMRNIGTLKEVASMKTWIISIARNTAVDLKRKQKWTRFLPDWHLEKEVDPETTEQKVMRKGDWLQVQDALLKLKPHYRSIVILRGVKELSVKETAEIVGCSEQKIRVDYHRAIQQLKKHAHSLQEGWGMTNENS